MTDTATITGLGDLRPGDVMFGPIGGIVPGVFPVAAGQLALGEAFRIGRLSIRHAAVVVKASEHLPPGTVRFRSSGRYYTPDDQREAPAIDDRRSGHYETYETGVITAPVIVEAMPKGARLRELRQATDWTDRHAYVRQREDYPGQAERAAAVAEQLVGTPYSFASYAALGAWRVGMHTERLEAYINRRTGPLDLPAELICSQLVDEAWTRAGKQVMPHGTRPQVVTPGGLAMRLWNAPGAIRGGVGVL